MKALIVILLLVGLALGGWKIKEYYHKVSQEEEAKRQAAAVVNISPEQLPGLPYQLEPSLRQAQEDGPKALKQWLETYRPSPLVKDPRLAWIELDYVLMLRNNPLEAKRVFAEVKGRIAPDPNSPVYRRIQVMEKTYE